MSDRKAGADPVDPGAAEAKAARRPTILVADDDVAVRRLATTILERHGYAVLGAPSGELVVTAFEAAKDRVNLVVLDQRMPGPGFEATLATLQAIEPSVRVLLMSGHHEPEVTPEIGRSLRGFLGKPFRGGELLRAVATALGGA